MHVGKVYAHAGQKTPLCLKNSGNFMTVPQRSHILQNMISLTEKYNNPRYIPPSFSESRCIWLFQKMVDATNAIIMICHKSAHYKNDCIQTDCLQIIYAIFHCKLLLHRGAHKPLGKVLQIRKIAYKTKWQAQLYAAKGCSKVDKSNNGNHRNMKQMLLLNIGLKTKNMENKECSNNGEKSDLKQ